MEHPDSTAETYESIPWSHLAPRRVPLPTRIAMVVVGAAVAAVLGFGLAKLFRDEPGRVVVTMPPAAVEGEQVPVPAPTTIPVAAPMPSSAAVPSSAPAADESRLFSEADLMAVIPEEEQHRAMWRAEWFVTDFFTVDGDPQIGTTTKAALPEDLDAPMPHSAAPGVSYVEWARALEARPGGPGRYEVDVAFRTLSGEGEGLLARQPVRAVRIQVEIGEGGGASILDLPAPIELAIPRAVVAYPAPAEAPPEIVDDAAAAVEAFGFVEEVLTAGVDENGWRVVLAVVDASGIRWPLAVRP
jgi:hypothetical protein